MLIIHYKPLAVNNYFIARASVLRMLSASVYSDVATFLAASKNMAIPLQRPDSYSTELSFSL